MSLYNAIFGQNPLHKSILHMLQLNPYKIARFRDAYVNKDGKLEILTRTGGGNRPDYEESNKALQEHPHYIEDFDDPIDRTYARFVFNVPGEFVDLVQQVVEKGFVFDPSEAWNKLFADLQGNKATEQTRNALAVGERIKKAMESPEGGTLIVNPDGLIDKESHR